MMQSSGLNKNYAAQIQRTIRKFQQRRVNIDDIYSYQGVLNKIGGMGEMVLHVMDNSFSFAFLKANLKELIISWERWYYHLDVMIIKHWRPIPLKLLIDHII